MVKKILREKKSILTNRHSKNWNEKKKLEREYKFGLIEQFQVQSEKAIEVEPLLVYYTWSQSPATNDSNSQISTICSYNSIAMRTLKMQNTQKTLKKAEGILKKRWKVT